jgi:hypothetical protein
MLQPCTPPPLSRSPIEFGTVVDARCRMSHSMRLQPACCFVVSIPSVKADYVCNMSCYTTEAWLFFPSRRQAGLFLHPDRGRDGVERGRAGKNDFGHQDRSLEAQVHTTFTP